MYTGMLHGALKRSFVTLLSQTQCPAAFGTTPHTLALEDYSSVYRPRTLRPFVTRKPRAGFWRAMKTLVLEEVSQ